MKKKAKKGIDLVVILGVFGLFFVLFFFLLTELPSDSDPLSNPDKHSDFYLFYKLYKKLGYSIMDYHSSSIAQNQEDLLICFKYDSSRRPLAGLVRQWVRRGGTVLVVGIRGERDPFSTVRFQTSTVGNVYQSDGSILHNFNSDRLRHALSRSRPNRVEVLLNSARGPIMYRIAQGRGSILILTDPALLSNQCLRRDVPALYFNRLLRPYYFKRIYVVSDRYSGRPETVSIMKLLLSGKLLFITLQLVWILLLFIIWQGKRLGEPQLVDPYAHRSLSEHLKAVGQFYRKTQALSIVDEINLEYFRYMLQKITGVLVKDPPRAEDILKITRYMAPDDRLASQEEILKYLRKEVNISAERLRIRGKNRDAIIKSLKKARPGKKHWQSGKKE